MMVVGAMASMPPPPVPTPMPSGQSPPIATALLPGKMMLQLLYNYKDVGGCELNFNNINFDPGMLCPYCQLSATIMAISEVASHVLRSAPS